jgi:hypothetical protein
MITEDSLPLRTCEGVSGVTVDYGSVYPNPVSANEKVNFTDSKALEEYTCATLYSTGGATIWNGAAGALAHGFKVPERSGTYVLVLSGGKGGTVKYKIIVN